ncbi:hypothetical protein FS837_002332 [Tulasnella sp. UAMH 9824]|nr:hypothetical protein FS837_002332 [Tulasnella sp. UAMH 9824]
MKIPNFAPLVLSNVSGYSTSDSSNQSALFNIDIGSQPYAPEPAIKDLPYCEDKDIQSNLVDSTYDFLAVGRGWWRSPRVKARRRGLEDLVIEAGKDHVTFNATIPLYLIQATEDPEMYGLGGRTIRNALINLIPHNGT